MQVLKLDVFTSPLTLKIKKKIFGVLERVRTYSERVKIMYSIKCEKMK
jgi:hypothetical protein